MAGGNVDGEKVRRAQARGQEIRAELVALLSDGSAGAAELLPLIQTPDVSLSEVAFQLDRLTEEGETVGKQGGSYQLTIKKDGS